MTLFKGTKSAEGLWPQLLCPYLKELTLNLGKITDQLLCGVQNPFQECICTICRADVEDKKQMGFIEGREISNNVLILQEMVHCLNYQQSNQHYSQN